MFKLLVIAVLMIIGNFWVAGFSCNSCGGECASACGSRRFRICCFNYLRKKRGQELSEIKIPNNSILEDLEGLKVPYSIPEDLELWWRNVILTGSSKFEPNYEV